MEHNKDIADIQAAEASFQKKKKFIICYHTSAPACKSARLRKPPAPPSVSP